MKNDNLNKIYLETIYPLQNNILTISSPNLNKPYKFNFVNTNNILPAIYKNMSIFYSALNKDPLHVITQSGKRAKLKYTHTDFLFIAQKTVDYYYFNYNQIHFNEQQSFRVFSKSHNDIIVPIQIVKNKITTTDKMELNFNFQNLFYSNYFVFIYTSLLPDMLSNNEYDLDISVENKQINTNILEIKVD